MSSQKNNREKEARRKHANGQQESEYDSGRGQYMNFFFDSVYQIVTWVLIAGALGFLLLFFSKENWRGVLWSSCFLLFFITVMVCLLAQRHFPIFRSYETLPPATQDDVNEIKRQLAELYASLRPPEKQINEKNPGLSLHTVLRLHAIAERRRKYLFDFGKTAKERLSVYLDPDNIFTFMLIDANGEPYSVRLPATDIPLDQFVYLSCEVGVGGQSTSLRVLVNGRQVGALDLPFRLDPGALDPAGSVIGADLNGKNGARFDMAEFLAYSLTLTSSEVEKLLQYFGGNPHIKFVQFSGKQWMRNLGSGQGLRQDIPELRPIFRILEGPKSN